jgi:hypothetical protein
MRRVAAALVIATVVVAGCGGTKWSSRAGAPTRVPTKSAAPAAGSAQGWVSYRDPSGVTLQHPPEWTTKPSQLGPMYIFVDPAGLGSFRRNINIVSQPVPAEMTPSEYLRLSLSQIAQLGGKIEDSRSALLGGLAARQMTWHLSKNGITVRFLSVWTLRSKAAYIVTYAADDAGFDAPIADVRRLIASVRLPA